MENQNDLKSETCSTQNSCLESVNKVVKVVSIIPYLNIGRWYSSSNEEWNYSEVLKGIGNFGYEWAKYGYGLSEDLVGYLNPVTQAICLYKVVTSVKSDNKSENDDTWFANKSWNAKKFSVDLGHVQLPSVKYEGKSYHSNNWFFNRSCNDTNFVTGMRFMVFGISMGVGVNKEDVKNRFFWGSTTNTKINTEFHFWRYKYLLSLETENQNQGRSGLNSTYMDMVKNLWFNTKWSASLTSGNQEFDKLKYSGDGKLTDEELKFTKNKNLWNHIKQTFGGNMKN